MGFLQLQPAGATLSCGAQASHCGGPSHCGTRALGAWASAVVTHELQSAGSVAVVHGPSRSAACGILQDQGSNLCPLHGQQTLNHCATREALGTFLKLKNLTPNLIKILSKLIIQ